MPFFNILRFYLQHLPGQDSTLVQLATQYGDTVARAFDKLGGAVGRYVRCGGAGGGPKRRCAASGRQAAGVAGEIEAAWRTWLDARFPPA